MGAPTGEMGAPTAEMGAPTAVRRCGMAAGSVTAAAPAGVCGSE
jgi:hypothetical protein